MTIIEAMESALWFLEAQGWKGSDTHGDLGLAMDMLKRRYPQAAKAELPERDW